MNDRPDLLLSLLDGLEAGERRFLLDQIDVAHAEQLERRRHPPHRRRRNEAGKLVWPQELGSEAS